MKEVYSWEDIKRDYSDIRIRHEIEFKYMSLGVSSPVISIFMGTFLCYYNMLFGTCLMCTGMIVCITMCISMIFVNGWEDEYNKKEKR